MNVAMLHFHLRRGGVTSVMLQQAQALAADSSTQITIFSGTEPDNPVLVPVVVVPGLDYDSFTKNNDQNLEAGAALLATDLERAFDRAFPGGCDLVHVHNPLLSKNRRLLGALRILQERGMKLLIQVHDWAEDFRPHVYERFWPYPERCHYAVINTRDRDHLIAAGLEPHQVHLLTNPVAAVEQEHPSRTSHVEIDSGHRTALYPVRAIRRKNIGEAILLSRFLPRDAELAVTLPPTSPGDLPTYRAWNVWSRERGYRVRFEAGMTKSLSDLYEQSFCAITTSVKEGFGYSYLDPLVRGLPVAGRAIPHLIRDFADEGVQFDNLYSDLRVPRDVLPVHRLRKAVDARIAELREAYGQTLVPEDLTRRFTLDLVDFGALDEALQTTVLERMDDDPGFERTLRSLNPFLDRLFTGAWNGDAARVQRQTALEQHSPRHCEELLRRVYSQTSVSVQGSIDKATLASLYLVPESFFLVGS